MAEDVGQVKTRLASLASRITNLETAVHKRLDAMQKQIDSVGARLTRSD
jgi:hypothetical protein